MARRGQRDTQGQRAMRQMMEWQAQGHGMRVSRHTAWELTNGEHGEEGCYTMETNLSTLAQKWVK